MNFIWLCVTWVIGVFTGAFFLIQPLIVIIFGIPFTLRLRRLGIMQGRGPLIQNCISLVLLPLLFWAATKGVQWWLPEHMAGYWIGVGIALLKGIGRCGANATNVQEYLQTNARYMDTEALQHHFPNP